MELRFLRATESEGSIINTANWRPSRSRSFSPELKNRDTNITNYHELERNEFVVICENRVCSPHRGVNAMHVIVVVQRIQKVGNLFARPIVQLRKVFS